MIVSIWRYSHLFLAISSSLFLLIASITGVILAVEPIANKVQPYNVSGADSLSLAEVLNPINAVYDEVLLVSRDRNGFVSVTVIIDGKNESFYIDPYTGERLGDLIQKAPVFQFATNLHRSLFLKSFGRFFVGLTSLLLFFIAVSGIVLIAKRQGGYSKFFSPVVRENFSQYHHVVYARIVLLPVLVLALTGVYLSLLRFDVIPQQQVSHEVDFDRLREEPLKNYKDFELLKNTSLSELRELEYPFSEFVEDYYIVRLKNKEVLLNQYTGEVLGQQKYPFVTMASAWANVLHTGEGSILWSTVLGLGSLSIPFLMVTGFIIYFKRPKTRIKNRFSKNECDHVILVGTEGGTTLQYAQEFHRQVVKMGKKSYLGLMNDYGLFKKMDECVVITATYGQGEAPASATRFMELVEKHPQSRPFSFSVIGFGSTAYPNFCQYAYDVQEKLKNLSNAQVFEEVFTVNNQSFQAFLDWTNRWAKSHGMTLHLKKPKATLHKNHASDFVVVGRLDLEKEDTFLLTLKNISGTKTVSGDLLSLTTEKDGIERLYSIGNLGNDILAISVKKHPHGICSNWLGQLDNDEILSARVVKNRHFHLPKGSKEAVLIATGTGIGPFLGMISSNTAKRKLRLYWGGRTPESFCLYQSHINKAISKKQLEHFIPAYSRSQPNKVYVQHLIKRDGNKIAEVLRKGGCVMICGSINMQGEVMNELKNICSTYLNKDLSYYQNRGQIKMDCY
ncbi:sulfite reductase (NADPH) flavoprotein alpha-component [Saonia flava]|uniref:NADPH--hemoprotein reductase n=1 Tax=Saonia flava TaxID=523696 RepID=A0A846QS52_9FLAO|nr:PepSY domain-containing protein [Saonia flava]NJB70898.1 sulfite reductase (NADPH) flavoprotein alpha-component [Saonia flava]